MPLRGWYGSVAVSLALQILVALGHERILRVNQAALDPGRLIRPKSVETAHGVPESASTQPRSSLGATPVLAMSYVKPLGLRRAWLRHCRLPHSRLS